MLVITEATLADKSYADKLGKHANEIWGQIVYRSQRHDCVPRVTMVALSYVTTFRPSDFCRPM